MKKVKVFFYRVHKNFEIEDIFWRIVQKKMSCRRVFRVETADIVIKGVYSARQSDSSLLDLLARSKETLKRRLLSLSSSEQNSRLRDMVDPKRKQIWVHLSGEAPNNTPTSSFLNSGCDFGVGHETIIDPNYIRMPHWYQSIDWGDEGFDRAPGAFYRLGRPIKIKELTSGILGREFTKKNNRCALIVSHMTSPRDVMLAQVSKVLPVDVYGLSGSGPTQYRSNMCKRDLLEKYSVVLAPENRLHPGYITEKVPEAFACGAFAIGWYLPGLSEEFSQKSHLNAADYGAKAISNHGEFVPILSNELRRTKSQGLDPLLDKAPSLEPIIEFIERVFATV